MKPQATDFLFNETGCISSETLLNYRDNKLDGDDKHAVEAHLVDCPLCSEALEGLGQARTESIKEIVASVRQIATQQQKPSRRIWYAAAAIACIFLATYVAIREFGDVSTERIAMHKTDNQAGQMETSLPETEGSGPATEQLNSTGNGNGMASDSLPQKSQKQVSEYGNKSTKDDFQKRSANSAVAERSSNNDSEVSESVSAVSAGISSAQSATVSENDRLEEDVQAPVITYIDNRKIVDYSAVETIQAVEADKPRQAQKQTVRKNEPPVQAEPESRMLSMETQPYRDEIADALALFNKGRYQSAIREFNTLLDKNPDDQNALYYRSLSWYHLNDYQKAAHGLAAFGNNPHSAFYEEGRFYYALSLMQISEKENGLKLLETIAAGTGPFSEKAKQALENYK